MENYKTIMDQIRRYDSLELLLKGKDRSEADELFRDYFAEKNIPPVSLDNSLEVPVMEYDNIRYFLEDTGISFNYPRSLIICKFSRFVPPHMHTHNYFEAIFVLSGGCSQTINGQTENMMDGDFCILSPYIRHAVAPEEDSLVLDMIISFPVFSKNFSDLKKHTGDIGDFFIDSLSSRHAEEYLMFHIGDEGSLRDLLLDMLLEMRNDDAYSDKIVTGMALQFFLKLFRRFDARLEESAQPASDNEIHDIIYNNYDTITLASLANHFHYTVPYCSKYLKNNLGCTFSELHQKIRFQKAEEFLLGSDLPVCKISARLGYETPQSFNRAFKRQYQMTPTEFRCAKLAEHTKSADPQ